MTLQEIMSKLVEMEAEAAIDLNAVDPRIRVGAEGRKRSAQASIETLRAQYIEALQPHLALVTVGGSYSSDFAKIAKENSSIAAIDYNFLINRLTKELQSRRATEYYGQNEHWMLLTSLNQLKNEYGFRSIAVPQLSQLSPAFNKHLAEGISLMLRETYNNSLSSAVLRSEISKLALASGFNSDKFPVLVYDCTQSPEYAFDINFLAKPAINLTIDEKPTVASVRKELTKIRSLLSPKAKSEVSGLQVKTEPSESTFSKIRSALAPKAKVSDNTVKAQSESVDLVIDNNKADESAE